jgi:hypothetical protein
VPGNVTLDRRFAYKAQDISFRLEDLQVAARPATERTGPQI